MLKLETFALCISENSLALLSLLSPIRQVRTAEHALWPSLLHAEETQMSQHLLIYHVIWHP